jgi:hypothetical protein
MPKFIVPVDARVTQQFNEWPEFYAQYNQKGHTGIDYGANPGTPVRAVADGVIKFEGIDARGAGGSWWLEIAGIVCAVQHDQYGVVTAYAHLSSTIVNKGQRVTQGQIIGYSGATGVATGPHLHFEVLPITPDFKNGYAGRINPAPYYAADPAPAATLADYQRVVVAAGVNYRKLPKSSGTLVETFKAGDTYDFKGYVHGETVEGNDIWFVGRYSGGYAWSGGFTDTSTKGLPDLTPAPELPAPKPQVPVVTPPAPAMFNADSAFVTEVIPSPNFVLGNIKPECIIMHQWDHPDKKPTYQGVVNGFVNGGLAPHYVVDNDHFTQMVLESNRAQHAGPDGNGVGIGIEADPNGGEAMYSRIRKYVSEKRKATGKPYPIVGHSKFVATDCPKYIDLYKCEPNNFLEPPVSRTDEYGKENNEILKQILAIVTVIKDVVVKILERFNGTFK